MTKLIVTPIDLSAPGSYRARQAFFDAVRRIDGLRPSTANNNMMNWDVVVAAYDAIEALLLPRLRTDDGTPVSDALDMLSAAEFDGLITAVTFGSETVSPTSASNSKPLSGERARRRRGR